MEILKIEDLTFTYPLCPTAAVSNVDLSINKGDFVVLCGATGSGKSTLLRLLKRELAPMGEKNGRILYKGTPTDELDPSVSAGSIGFVMQNTAQQIVTDKVWHELSFGLESMGLPRDVIARRVCEMASYFGIEEWYEKNVSQLSGGQLQLLNLASVMVMDPDILILDEPTAQLDPIAAADFIATLKKLNNELSLTVIIAEHRLEELVPVCDRLVVMEQGMVVKSGAPREVIRELDGSHPLFRAMPTAARLYRAVNHLTQSEYCPLTVREGRRFLESAFDNHVRTLAHESYTHSDREALELLDVYFKYDRDGGDILRGMELTVYSGEIFCVLGGNGSGKTTSLGVASGLFKPYSGSVRIFGKRLKDYKGESLYRGCVSLLPQDVQTVFLKNTVSEELEDVGADVCALPFDISGLLEKHPYDLSGGEQQLVALAKVLATKPRLLLMDEPTKGLDAERKIAIIDILRRLRSEGVTVVIVTHDVEFSAMCADRCALCFRGQMMSVGAPHEFFSQNRFYTTAASRMSKGYYDGAVTVEDLSELCRINSADKEGGV